jgi:hypothetical protein
MINTNNASNQEVDLSRFAEIWSTDLPALDVIGGDSFRKEKILLPARGISIMQQQRL